MKTSSLDFTAALAFMSATSALVCLMVACQMLGAGGGPHPIESPNVQAEASDPVAMVTGGIDSLTKSINAVVADGLVEDAETGQLSQALQDFGQTMVSAYRQSESNLRAQIRQAQAEGGDINWPATLLQVGLSAVLGGGLGFQIVRKAPNRMILGTEPDPEVAQVAAARPGALP